MKHPKLGKQMWKEGSELRSVQLQTLFLTSPKSHLPFQSPYGSLGDSSKGLSAECFLQRLTHLCDINYGISFSWLFLGMVSIVYFIILSLVIFNSSYLDSQSNLIHFYALNTNQIYIFRPDLSPKLQTSISS